MEYNLSINQRVVYELGLQDKLDAIDLLLFDFIYNLMNDPKSIKSTIKCSDGKERVFTMIRPKLVSEECPILNINNRVTFTKRISRLVDAGLIIRYERNQAEGWSFYARGELFMVFKKGDVNCFTPCKQSLTLSVNDDLHYHNTSNINDVSSDEDTECVTPPTSLEDNIDLTPYNPPSLSAEERTFDEFRRAYKGTKRGLKTEFDNFRKKHKDWRDVLTHLMSDYQKQEQIREANGRNGAFVPQPKNLQTYINQRCWEDEIQLAQPQYGKQSNSKFADPQQSMLAIIEGARAGVAERNNTQGFI